MLASLARGCSAPKSLGRLGEAGSPASERAEASLRSRAAAIVVGAIVGERDVVRRSLVSEDDEFSQAAQLAA